MAVTNSYGLTNTSLAYTYWNGSSYSTSTSERVAEANLKTYTVKLGEAYAYDIYGINNGYSVLAWENQREAMALNKKQEYIKVGETLNLNILENEEVTQIINNNYDNTNFTWKSTNEDIASVNENGVVTGLKDGYTTIYAKHEESGIYAMCIVNVSQNEAMPQVLNGNKFTIILKSNGTVWSTRK